MPNRLRLLAAGAALTSMGLFASCGGDDGDPGEESSSGAVSGTDRKYVAALCKASLAFNDSYMDILKDPENVSKSPSEALKLFARPYEAFIKELDRAHPPSDARAYHDDMVDALTKNLSFFKEGDTDAIDTLIDNEFPAPPEAASRRFQEAASDDRDCKRAGVTFED